MTTSPAPSRPRLWRVGLILNLLVRVSILYFLVEVLLFPDDPRFAGKAIPIRNFVIVGGMSLVFPALYFLRRRWPTYPVYYDSLYLSMFWLDMAGNSFNLYNRYEYFDLIPHLHGTGAIAVVLNGALGVSVLGAVGLTTIFHTLLEAQEYYTDVFFGTQNVHGIADTINDLLVGILGATLYSLIHTWWRNRAARR